MLVATIARLHHESADSAWETWRNLDMPDVALVDYERDGRSTLARSFGEA